MTKFSAKRVTRTHTIELAAPAQRVFPLFEPIGEKLWAEGWDPHMLYPASGATQEGSVFTTQGHDSSTTIWTVIHFDPEKFQITYLRVTPDSNVVKVEIHCVGSQAETAQARITYTFTALTEKGNQYVDQFTEAHYSHWIEFWGMAINHFLKHGTSLKHH